MKLSLGICMMLLIGVKAALAQAPPPAPAPRAVIDQTCMSCHGSAGVERAPDVITLRQMTPEKIYEALTTGSMRVHVESLPDGTRRGIAEWLADRKLGSGDVGDASAMPNRCAGPSSAFSMDSVEAWNGWGADLENTRFQPERAAGLTADDVGRLKLKWAFAFPGASVMYGQPAIAGGRLFAGADSGYIYALDAATGCVHWSFQAQAGVRTAVIIAPLSSQRSRHAAHFGDLRGNVYALDAGSGELIWKTRVDEHGIARVTGTPALYGNRLYVPVASMEESTAANPNYSCCTFRGSVVALDADTGRQLWKTYTIDETPKPTKKNSRGVQQWAPAGGAVWGTPTIDLKRRAVYISTGNAYTTPAPKTTDAIIALDMDTGKVLWSVQDIPDDAWIAGCGPFADPSIRPSENCPEDMGPDYDFSAGVTLKTLPDGRRVLVAGQKSGIVWAHDPDREGALVWKKDVSRQPPGPQGELVWGGAADDRKVYFGVNSGGLVALQLDSGQTEWFTPLDPAEGRPRGNSGAVTAIPGVVFATGWDGVLRAFSADKGALLWEFNTVRSYETVNGLPARGGSMGAQGATVAGGMVFVGSGYIGFQNGTPGNVLLAFSPE
jgi:polyvinyl alcohol dehydrogenase (cytochrome)